MEKRIIVIEDDPLYRRLVKEYLKESKLIIDHATYATEGIKKIEKEKYDLIISDLRLPDASGRKIVEFVAQHSNIIPIIIMTAYPDIGEAIELMKLGIFDYLTKPIDRIKLLLTIEKAFHVKELVNQKKELEVKVSEFDLRLEYLVMEKTRKISSDYKKLKELNLDSIRVLSETIESKDPFTRGHCLRVSKYSLSIAKELGFSKKQLELLEIGALLHDIGKIGVRGAILNKGGKLTKSEWAHVMLHPVIGESILEKIDFFKKVMPIIRNHHERFDGKGYPDGLRAHEIPIESKIVCVVDAFDAMVSDRPYRKGMKEEEAIDRLKRASGEQFDSRIVDVFLQNQIYLSNDNNFKVEIFDKIQVGKK